MLTFISDGAVPMSIREQRKKVQRTIIHMAADYPPEVAIPQLRLIAKTLAALIPNDDEEAEGWRSG